jgi:tRNA-2-methylthio-N6-dimethylallyladenosine synthase
MDTTQELLNLKIQESTEWQSPPRYYTWTVGCQMNKADTERLESAFSQMGFLPTTTPANADVIVLNSCVVRQSAEDKVVGTITSLKPLKKAKPTTILAVMGCMVGPNQQRELQKTFPYVDVFMQPQQYKPLLDLLGNKLDMDWEGCVGTLAPLNPQVTTYVPIIHGCDEMCSFCIIPYKRGREVSRTIDDIVNEIEHLVPRGVREVTLLGQTVDAYGNDLKEKVDLANLLEAVNEITGIDRIRFLTSHPNYMSKRIIEAVASLPKVCEHINIPIQAGSDSVLERMRRPYSVHKYLSIIDTIRATVPSVSISTDIIVGFPGETEEDFEGTIRVLEEVRFDKVHTAAYSPRPGTIASRKIPDDVPTEEKQRRKHFLENLQQDINSKINNTYLGNRYQILVEGHERGRWKGRTRTDKIVFFESKSELLGKLVIVEVQSTGPWSLKGTLIQD